VPAAARECYERAAGRLRAAGFAVAVAALARFLRAFTLR
jgi:hypothetical protein